MNKKGFNLPKILLLFGSFLAFSCQSPVTSVYHGPSSNASLGKGLTVSWATQSTSARTIMPSTFPSPVTYNVTLQPTSGNAVSQNGLTATSWTFSNLSPGVYSVTVVGLDGSANTIVQGTSSVDTTTNSAASVSVTLNYALTGVGTGQINLTLNLASAGVGATTASVKLVDPSGNVSIPTLTGTGAAGSNYTYTNTSAAVGSWKAFFMVQSGTQTAMKMESILVFQNVPTTASLTFASADFNATYVPVSGITLGQTSVTLSAPSATLYAATLSPSNASNQLVVWSSSNPQIAEVNPQGWVTANTPGSATITATSVDNPLQSESFFVSVVYTLTFDSQSADTPATPSAITFPSVNLTLTSLPTPPSKAGYTFVGWWTGMNGTGTQLVIGASVNTSVTYYAEFSQWLVTFFKGDDQYSGVWDVVGVPLGGTVVNMPTNPLMTGAVFLGWSQEPGSMGGVEQVDFTNTTPVTHNTGVFTYFRGYNLTVIQPNYGYYAGYGPPQRSTNTYSLALGTTTIPSSVFSPTPPATFTWQGTTYVFSGWSGGFSAGGPINGDATTMANFTYSSGLYSGPLSY